MKGFVWKVKFMIAYCNEYGMTRINCKIGWRLADKALVEFGWAFSPQAACIMKVNEERIGV